MSASDPRFAAWRKTIDETTDPAMKQVLESTYQKMLEQAQKAPTKYNPSLVQGARPSSVSFMWFRCLKSTTKKCGSKGKEFHVTEITCTRDGLPFVEVFPTDSEIEVTDCLSGVNFTLPHVSKWTNSNIETISCTGKVVIRLNKSVCPDPGWYRFNDVHVVQRPAKNGDMYANVNCSSIEAWKDAPSYMAMHALISRVWINDRYMPRVIDPKFYPPQDLVSQMKQKLLSEKPSSSSSSAPPPKEVEEVSAEDTPPNEETSTVDYKLHRLAYAMAFDQHVRSLGIEWQRHPDLLQQHPNSRHPWIFPLTLGDHISQRMVLTGDTITQLCNTLFSGDIRVKQEGVVKVFGQTEDNKFTMHLTSAVNANVMRITKSTGDITMMTLAVSIRMQDFFHQFGIINPHTAAGILPRILPTVPMSVIGTVSAQNTRDKNLSDDTNHCVVIDVFTPPVIDPLEMIRANGVQVTPRYAIDAVNAYIKSAGTTIKIKDNKAKAFELADKSTNSIYKFIAATNKLSEQTEDMIHNCMESRFSVDEKKGKEWRFYALTGQNPVPEQVAHYYETVRAFHAAQPGSPEALELDEVLNNYAERFSVDQDLTKTGFFVPNETMIGWGVTPVTIIFAVSKTLDHQVVIDYDNKLFSEENIRKHMQHVKNLKESRARPVISAPASSVPPAPAEEPLSLEVTDDTLAIEPAVVDDEEVDAIDDVPVVEAPTRSRKRAPTSPGKRGAVSKKERNR